MENNTVKIKVNLSEGTFEIEGNQEFVKEHIYKIPKLFEQQSSPIQQKKPIENNKNGLVVHNTNEETSEESYIDYFGFDEDHINNLFHIDYDTKTIKILTDDIKGKNAQKQREYSKLYLYVKEFLGEDFANYQELRDLCKYHSCLNTNNFSQYFETKDFIVEGSKNSPNKKVKLTSPGKQSAKDLIAELMQE